MTPAETLMHNTVRLECKLGNDQTMTGTGFFFAFKVDDTTHVPVIVTNRHVVKDSKVGTFVLTRSNERGEPILGSTERIVLDNFESRWLLHPDATVDLAVFPLAPLYHHATSKGISFFAPPMSEDLLATSEKLADLSGLETITWFSPGLVDRLVKVHSFVIERTHSAC